MAELIIIGKVLPVPAELRVRGRRLSSSRDLTRSDTSLTLQLDKALLLFCCVGCVFPGVGHAKCMWECCQSVAHVNKLNTLPKCANRSKTQSKRRAQASWLDDTGEKGFQRAAADENEAECGRRHGAIPSLRRRRCSIDKRPRCSSPLFWHSWVT